MTRSRQFAPLAPLAILPLAILIAACGGAPRPEPARHLVLVTIDTMRADHVGAYGYGRARTPSLDRLARDGTRFDRAYATAPITLTSHASLLSGRYPPGHGARDNGMAVDPGVPTLAAHLKARGFRTGAFVAAYPLDRRFGLSRGFDLYSDRMPRFEDGTLAVERPARVVVDEALAWFRGAESRAGGAPRTFLWVHLFEPHAPYGDPVHDPRPAIQRYDSEIAAADQAAGRLLEGLGPEAGCSLVVAVSDHGEAFGEHGETGHSIFVYDTTLRVAFIVAGPRVPAGRSVGDPVSLVDVVPTVLSLLGEPALDTDGIDLSASMAGARVRARALYAESFAPLIDFGWSALRAIRQDGLKAIAAPRPELYDLTRDPAEMADLSPSADRGTAPGVAASRLQPLLDRVERYSGDRLRPPAESGAGPPPIGRPDRSRLGALGYVQGGAAPSSGPAPDPKDRRELAARIAEITSGELRGDALLAALQTVVRDDPRNGQMRIRLGDLLLDRAGCAAAEPHFRAAIALGVPTADAHLGLARCQADAGRFADAVSTLEQSQSLEADNPVVLANLGLLHAAQSKIGEAIARLRQALDIDPDFHEARFDLARLLARAGRRDEARREAESLLARLPPGAPQRPEVERLLAALR